MADEQPTTPEPKREILVTYLGDVSKIPISPVSGAYGGVDPYAEMIVANFFLEQLTMPVAGHMTIDDNGVIDPNSEKVDKRSDVQRTYVATLTMSPAAARRIAEWLEKQAKIIEELRGGQS